MAYDDYVTLTNIEVGDESASGQAVRIVDRDGESHWIPLSQVHSIHRDPRSRYCDKIEISRWFANKQGLVEDE